MPTDYLSTVHEWAWMNTPRSFAKAMYLILNEEKGLAALKSHIAVSKPDGSVAPIPALECTMPSKMLGIYFAPFDGTEQMKRMCTNGMEWVCHGSMLAL